MIGRLMIGLVTSLAWAMATVAFGQTTADPNAKEGSSATQAPAQSNGVGAPCQLPGAAMAGAASLPRIAEAIKRKKSSRILVIGASSSAFMRDTGTGYYTLIETLLEKTIPGVDVHIVDRSVSGEIARDAVEHMRSEVALEPPDLVLWQLGGSDTMARIDAGEFEKTVDEGISWLHGHGIDVAIIGMSFVRNLRADTHYQAIRNALVRVSQRHKVLRIGRYEAMQMLDHAQAHKDNGPVNEFALTEDGYDCLSEYVVRMLTAGIFVKAGQGNTRAHNGGAR